MLLMLKTMSLAQRVHLRSRESKRFNKCEGILLKSVDLFFVCFFHFSLFASIIWSRTVPAVKPAASPQTRNISRSPRQQKGQRKPSCFVKSWPTFGVARVILLRSHGSSADFHMPNGFSAIGMRNWKGHVR
jgi:hypothetical protein